MHDDLNGRPGAAETGCVAHLSAGGWGEYHRMSCAEAPVELVVAHMSHAESTAICGPIVGESPATRQ